MGQRFSPVLSAVSKTLRAVGRLMPSILCDAAGFGGAVLVSYGAWLIYAPTGFITGGILLIVFAVFVGIRLNETKSS